MQRARASRGCLLTCSAVPAVLEMEGAGAGEEGGDHEDRHLPHRDAAGARHREQRQSHEGAPGPLRPPQHQVLLHAFQIVQRVQTRLQVLRVAGGGVLAAKPAEPPPSKASPNSSLDTLTTVPHRQTTTATRRAPCRSVSIYWGDEFPTPRTSKRDGSPGPLLRLLLLRAPGRSRPLRAAQALFLGPAPLDRRFHVLYINLERDVERREKYCAAMPLAYPEHLAIERVPGVAHRWGVEGCRAAHSRALARAHELGHRYVFVTEDDVAPSGVGLSLPDCLSAFLASVEKLDDSRAPVMLLLECGEAIETRVRLKECRGGLTLGGSFSGGTTREPT